MKVSTGPDTNYGCEMSDGKKFSGSLRTVAKNAASYTLKSGAHVMTWMAPGSSEVIRRQRGTQLHEKYTEELDALGKAGSVTAANPDWRTQAFLILDRKFSESQHLSTGLNANGDYEVRCSKCGKVEIYPHAGDRKVDAYTFALQFTGQHAHQGQQ